MKIKNKKCERMKTKNVKIMKIKNVNIMKNKNIRNVKRMKTRNVKRMKTRNVNIMYIGTRRKKKTTRGHVIEIRPSLLVVLFVSSTTPWFRAFLRLNSSWSLKPNLNPKSTKSLQSLGANQEQCPFVIPTLVSTRT
jgi:hypothetical protein